MAGAEGRVLIDGTGHGLADDIGQFHFRRGSHFDVAEAEISGGGVEAFAFFSTLEGIIECCLGRAKVLCIDGTGRAVVAATAVARRVRHLAEAEAKLGSARTFGSKADPSRSVLPEVDDGGLACLQGEVVLSADLFHDIDSAEGLVVGLRAFVYLDGLGVATQSLYCHDGRSFEGSYLTLEVVRFRCSEPIAVVVVGRELSFLEPGIIGLAVVDVAFAQRAVGVAEPSEVGGNGYLRSVLEFNLQQSAEGIGFVTVHAVDNATVPPAR